MSNLAGSYKIDKSNLLADDFHLVIGTRKTPTPTKPKYYLLRRDSSSKHQFISSLYPEPQESAQNGLQVYSMDFAGVTYRVAMDREAGVAQFSQVGKGQSGGVQVKVP